MYSFWCDVCLTHLATGVNAFCQNYLRPSQRQMNKDNWLQVTISNSVSSIDDDICKMGVYFLNCVKAYTQIQMFLENTNQDIASDCNPDISHHLLFGHAINALTRKRCMTYFKKLHLPAVRQKSSTRQCLRKPFLITQNMVFGSISTTKYAISQ